MTLQITRPKLNKNNAPYYCGICEQYLDDTMITRRPFSKEEAFYPNARTKFEGRLERPKCNNCHKVVRTIHRELIGIFKFNQVYEP